LSLISISEIKDFTLIEVAENVEPGREGPSGTNNSDSKVGLEYCLSFSFGILNYRI